MSLCQTTIKNYKKFGVVLIKNIISKKWIETLAKGIETGKKSLNIKILSLNLILQKLLQN